MTLQSGKVIKIGEPISFRQKIKNNSNSNSESKIKVTDSVDLTSTL